MDAPKRRRPGKRKRPCAQPAVAETQEVDAAPSEAVEAEAARRWVLVTGQPGCGKTTLVKNILAAGQSMGSVKFSGFYTDEVLRGGKRIGFDVVTIPDGRRGVLSRKSREGRYAACPRVGAYSVDVSAFEQLALPTLSPADDPENTIVVIDEIGRMELKSDAFKNAVEKLLGDPRRRVFGAITAPIYGHRVPFCDSITGMVETVETHRIKKSNRDDVAQMLSKKLRRAWARVPVTAASRVECAEETRPKNTKN